MAKPKQSAERPPTASSAQPKPGSGRPQPSSGQAKSAPGQPKGRSGQGKSSAGQGKSGASQAKAAPVPARAVKPRSSAPKAQPLPPLQQEPMPSTVRNAVRLMYAGAAFSAIDLIVSLVTAGQISTAIQNAHPTWSHARITANAHAELTASVIVWLVTIGFWVVMARTNQAGRGWARIVATVLSVLSTLSFVEAVIQPGPLVSKLIYLPLWAVGVAAVILLWRPATTDYIRAARPTRP
jgi:hypothetical protein